MTLIICRNNSFEDSIDLIGDGNPIISTREAVVFVGDSMSSRNNNNGEVVPMMNYCLKIVSVPLSYKIPIYNMGYFSGWRKIDCENIGIAFAGSQLIAYSAILHLQKIIETLAVSYEDGGDGDVVMSYLDPRYVEPADRSICDTRQHREIFSLASVAELFSSIVKSLSMDYGVNNTSASIGSIGNLSCISAIGGFCRKEHKMKMYIVKPEIIGGDFTVSVKEITENENFILGENLKDDIDQVAGGSMRHCCVVKKFSDYVAQKVDDEKYPTIGGRVSIGWAADNEKNFTVKTREIGGKWSSSCLVF